MSFCWEVGESFRQACGTRGEIAHFQRPHDGVVTMKNFGDCAISVFVDGDLLMYVQGPPVTPSRIPNSQTRCFRGARRITFECNPILDGGQTTCIGRYLLRLFDGTGDDCCDDC